MLNVRCEFQEREVLTPYKARKREVISEFQEMKCHLITEIKMGGKFTRKDRFAAVGNTTEPPASLTYSSVFSIDSVCIEFTLTDIFYLDIWACDIGNSFLSAKCGDKIWTKSGTVFGNYKGKVMTIIKDLHGLKSSGAAWRALLAEMILELGYKPSISDMYVWAKS